MTLLRTLVFCIHITATLGLLIYGLNCYVLLVLFARKRTTAYNALSAMRRRLDRNTSADRFPVVTSQIAIYNEYNVSERVIRAACAMGYPAGKHEIQVLDDSTDETRELVDRVVAELRSGHHDVKVLRREVRTDFKAGALANGLRQARGEILAVFDADFVPPRDYLMSTVPFFMERENLGFLQTRWGHLNRSHSFLTRVQSIGIDGHFIVEQIARCWNGLYMNFNGTAGLWRREAIDSAGGWQGDTLTEDLDLSYRVQFAGWEPLYLPDVVVPAELPEDVNAFRGQQFRWAKGSVQTLIKLFPQLVRAPVSPFKKIQAVLHMGGYLVHPLMLILSLLALPILYLAPRLQMAAVIYGLVALPLALSVIAPSTLYLVSQKVAHKDWRRRVMLLPMLVVVGVGMAFSNAKAIFEAIVGKRTEFVRTPKRGDRHEKRYVPRVPKIALIEIALGLYSSVSLSYYMMARQYLISPFLALYAAGFLFVGTLTILHGLGLGERR